MNRRKFIKNMAMGLGSLSPMVNIGGLSLVSVPASAASPDFSDYKAIIMINLTGGNDSMNMFIPNESSAYSLYESTRRNLALGSDNLFNDSNYPSTDTSTYFQISGGAGESNPYYATAPSSPVDYQATSNLEASYRKGSYHTGDGLGICAFMPEFADLYQKGKLSIVSNVGTLVKPTTKAAIEAKTAELPLFLFAHNHQQRLIQTAQSDILSSTGWAGKLADAWSPINSPVGLNISFAGNNRMQIGASTASLSMGNSPVSYDDNAVSTTTSYEQFLQKSADEITNNDVFKHYYAQINKTAGQLSTSLSTAWANAPDFSAFTAKNTYGQTLFTVPDNTLAGLDVSHSLKSGIFRDLETAAKMIKLGKNDLAYKRQIFYVQQGGYDSHSGQIEDHGLNLRALSLALSDFYKSLEEMGLSDKVMVVSTSDFGRTLKSNGDGTDHGWGGHSFMLCGDSAFNGGKTFGTVMTDLSLTGVNAHTNKARMIPTTSIEQMLAPALQWFGVNNTLMPSILPNLANFQTSSDDLESAFLQNVFTAV